MTLEQFEKLSVAGAYVKEGVNTGKNVYEGAKTGTAFAGKGMQNLSNASKFANVMKVAGPIMASLTVGLEFKNILSAANTDV